MKVNELMIGDWVMDGKNIAQITSITCDGIIETTFNESSNIEVIEPISLTHEILVKIGFSTEPNIGYIIDDYDGTQIIYDSWNNNLRIIKDYKTCLDIKTFNDLTVHELQHALRICGVEKEIEL